MKHKQYTFHLTPVDSYHIDDFIVSSSNFVAYQTINLWPSDWGHLPFPNSLLLYGPISSGKTYLTKIWQHRSIAYLIDNVQDFTEEILCSHPAFIIEDIEGWEEEVLLHYFNWINESKKPLLLTTSRIVNNFSLNDLSSRINSITKIEIKAPDDELIKIFLFKLFSNNSVKVSPQVQEYLLSHLPRQFSETIKCIRQINDFALTNKRSLTVPLVKEVMTIVNNYGN